MSGHNKWSKIKHKKAASDAQKSKVFGKVGRLITAESKKTGGIESPSLRAAIEKAKEVNMPKDAIERAVKKGAGADASQMEGITYEAYGPGGTGIIIETLTDNRNKASAEIKHILSKNGSSLAGIGAVTWAFEKNDGEWKPKTMTPISETDGEKLNKLIEELEENDEVQEVFTNAE